MNPSKYLCWLDLETTGLSPVGDLIVEVGFILTHPDPPFEQFDSFTAVVDHGVDARKFMNDYVTAMHAESGLLTDLDAGTAHGLRYVEARAIDLLDCWGVTGDFMLCGSGVSRFDREFLAQDMPTLNRWFRPDKEIDVSTMRTILTVAGRGDLVATDTARKAHRALPDAIDHHREFQAYTRLLDDLKVAG